MNMMKRWTPFEASAIGAATRQKQKRHLRHSGLCSIRGRWRFGEWQPIESTNLFQDTGREGYVKALRPTGSLAGQKGRRQSAQEKYRTSYYDHLMKKGAYTRPELGTEK